MEEINKAIRIAAVGDIHISLADKGKWNSYFKAVSEKADILIICGDLTDTGHATEAEVLAGELKNCQIPVITVFGNHDYESDEQDQLKAVLVNNGIYVLDGESAAVKGVGFAGIKGFGGGFGRHSLPMWGEQMNKKYVQETVSETLKLDKALTSLSKYKDSHKIVLLHYAPVKDTVMGEPEAIFPFMGSSRLVEPIDTRHVTAVFHGHAHLGAMKGKTPRGIQVFNVSKPVLEKAGYDPPFFVYEISNGAS